MLQKGVNEGKRQQQQQDETGKKVRRLDICWNLTLRVGTLKLDFWVIEEVEVG